MIRYLLFVACHYLYLSIYLSIPLMPVTYSFTTLTSRRPASIRELFSDFCSYIQYYMDDLCTCTMQMHCHTGWVCVQCVFTSGAQ